MTKKTITQAEEAVVSEILRCANESYNAVFILQNDYSAMLTAATILGGWLKVIDIIEREFEIDLTDRVSHLRS